MQYEKKIKNQIQLKIKFKALFTAKKNKKKSNLKQLYTLHKFSLDLAPVKILASTRPPLWRYSFEDNTKIPRQVSCWIP